MGDVNPSTNNTHLYLKIRKHCTCMSPPLTFPLFHFLSIYYSFFCTVLLYFFLSFVYHCVCPLLDDNSALSHPLLSRQRPRKKNPQSATERACANIFASLSIITLCKIIFLFLCRPFRFLSVSDDRCV